MRWSRRSVCRAMSVLCLGALSSTAWAFDDLPTRVGVDFAGDRSTQVIDFATPRLTLAGPTSSTDLYPRSAWPDGTWSIASRDIPFSGTQSFFPGALWYMYQLTGDPVWQTRAGAWTLPVEAPGAHMFRDFAFKVSLRF